MFFIFEMFGTLSNVTVLEMVNLLHEADKQIFEADVDDKVRLSVVAIITELKSFANLFGRRLNFDVPFRRMLWMLWRS